jgi:hypothetical protein
VAIEAARVHHYGSGQRRRRCMRALVGSLRRKPFFFESIFFDQNNLKRQTADPYGVHRNWTYSE